MTSSSSSFERERTHLTPWSRPVQCLAGVLAVFYLAQFFFRSTPLFTEVLTPPRIAPFVSAPKWLAQGMGAYFAARCAQHHAAESPIRRAWSMMSGWLGCWCIGQLCLAYYVVVLGERAAPNPSIADVFFFAGYALVLPAMVTFAVTYVRSGFAVGSIKQHLGIACMASAAFGVTAWRLLLPIALEDTPILERVVNVGYPLLDLVTLIPAVVLLRITLAFRGGRVWQVWGVLLIGLVFAMAGDILFADTSSVNLIRFGPIADLSFTLGYVLCAYGARLQYELERVS